MLAPCWACTSCCIPGPGTPSFPGLGRRCAVPKVIDPGLGTVDSGWGPTEDCRGREAHTKSAHELGWLLAATCCMRCMYTGCCTSAACTQLKTLQLHAATHVDLVDGALAVVAAHGPGMLRRQVLLQQHTDEHTPKHLWQLAGDWVMAHSCFPDAVCCCAVFVSSYPVAYLESCIPDPGSKAKSWF